MSIFDFTTMLGGLALFLYGMHNLSASIEKMSGSKLSAILEKLTGSVWKSILLGLGITAVVQSSSATTVITVGLVNSGVLKLGQAIGIIMGSNVGTTVTAHLLRLTDIESDNFFMMLFKPSTFAPILALIGAAMVMFSKRTKTQTIGEILVSFGVLFIGMLTMEDSLSGLRESQVLANVFTAFGDNFILGILAGAAVTAVIQSSSASVGILQALSSTGAITYAAAIPIILGQNIGTTVTSLISVIGASKSAKRAALSHLYFNVIGTVIFAAAVFAVKSSGILDFWELPIDKGGIANFHTIFNVAVTLLFIPFTKLLEKLCMLSIPADGSEIDIDTSILDERLLSTPSVAVEQSEIILRKLCGITRDMVGNALNMINTPGIKGGERVSDEYTAAMKIEDALHTYLLKIAERELSDSVSEQVTGMLTRSDDCRHIVIHAMSIKEAAEDLGTKNSTGLTKDGQIELALLSSAVLKLMESVVAGSDERNKRTCAETEPLCVVIGEMTELIRSRHLIRLKTGECSYESGTAFVGVLIDIDRITKHCSSMGVSLAIEYKKRSNIPAEEYARRLHRGDTEHFTEHYMNYKTEYYSPLIPEEE